MPSPKRKPEATSPIYITELRAMRRQLAIFADIINDAVQAVEQQPADQPLWCFRVRSWENGVRFLKASTEEIQASTTALVAGRPYGPHETKVRKSAAKAKAKPQTKPKPATRKKR